MSYARFGPDSDVYVYLSTSGWETGRTSLLVCCGCLLGDGGHHATSTVNAMLDHLAAHTAAGHQVPAYTVQALDSEHVELDVAMATPPPAPAPAVQS